MTHHGRIAAVLTCWLSGAAIANGQVLVTGETGGAGGQAVVVSANLLKVKDFSTLANYWAEYGYGLTDRIDVFAAYGNISVFGDTQHYVGGGSNIAVLRRGQQRIDLSFFNNASIALTRRDQACSVLLTLALVASHPLPIGSLVVTPYGGFSTLAPIGHRDRGVFTPIDNLHTGIIGLAIPLGKAWSVFGEYNPGPHLQSGGVAIVYVRPRQAIP